MPTCLNGCHSTLRAVTDTLDAVDQAWAYLDLDVMVPADAPKDWNHIKSGTFGPDPSFKVTPLRMSVRMSINMFAYVSV